MPRCCPGVLPPKIEEGRHIEVTGNGTPQSPLVVSATTALDVIPNDTFNLILTGNGTLDSPWQLAVIYSPLSKLDDIGDVFATGATPNGYVLAWDTTNSRWQAAPPSVAPVGAVLAGNGLTGDGSAPNPLNARLDPARYLTITSSGLGLSDEGINSLVRVFPDATARAAATPAPRAGTVSLLLNNPDSVDYWDGDKWVAVTGGRYRDIKAGQLLSLSGAYAGGKTTQYVAQLSVVTDATGAFEAIPATDLTGYSGVLACDVQETGTTVWHCQVRAGSNNIIGVAYGLGTGTPLTSATLSGTVTALLY